MIASLGVGICLWLVTFSSIGRCEIERRADAPKPLTPEESAKRFRLPEDLQVELVAAEPLVQDPTAIAFDPQGRMFVCELHGFNLGLHLEVQKLNKSGVLDRGLRRPTISPEVEKEAEEQTYGTIKLLVDENGDGRMDRADVWADRLPPCLGLVPARGGFIVVSPVEIFFLADIDQDGRAEIRETLFRGFGRTMLERSINSPCWGLDNWIYVAGGVATGHVTGPNLSAPVRISATDFRFRADGSAIEPVTGKNMTFGLTFNDWGDRFLNNTRSPVIYPVPLPYRYLARNPYMQSPVAQVDAADYNQVYPTSQPHPWRVARSQEAGWEKLFGDYEVTGNGYFTSVSGQMIYRAATLPARFHGNHFSCEPAQNLIHRCMVKREGLRFSACRAADEEQSEFLTSTDQWFRPINLATGLDGSIYIVDMYREIIDGLGIPRYLQQQYGLIEGNDRGRIWRIVSKAARGEKNCEALQPLLQTVGVSAEASEPADETARLVGCLSHSSAWWRATAQRLLVEKRDEMAVESLASLASNGQSPQARLHALYTLEGLDALAPELVEQAISDSNSAVRWHALRLCEPWLDQRPATVAAALARVNDPDIKVRLQLAMTLGQIDAQSDGPQVLLALEELAQRDGEDPWMQAAILSSVVDLADTLLARLLGPNRVANSNSGLLRSLASIVGARRQDDQIAALLQVVASLGPADLSATGLACLEGLAEGLQGGRLQPLAAPLSQSVLRPLLANDDDDLRDILVQITSALQFSDCAELQAVFADARAAAINADWSIHARQRAIRLLAYAPFEMLAETSELLINVRQPPEIQLAAIQALSATDESLVASALLRNWKAYTPSVKDAVLDAILAHTNRLDRLLVALEKGSISPGSLSTAGRLRLLENPDEEIRRRAGLLLSPPKNGKRFEQLENYRAALEHKRDVERGKALFGRVCAACHRLGDQGYQVGPDLTIASNRSDEALLLDILAPSDQISAGYRSYVIVDNSGRIFTGVLTSETAAGVTLRQPKAPNEAEKDKPFLEHTILRKDIEAMNASDQSLMPDNLEKELSPQDVADVIAYVRQTLAATPRDTSAVGSK